MTIIISYNNILQRLQTVSYKHIFVIAAIFLCVERSFVIMNYENNATLQKVFVEFKTKAFVSWEQHLLMFFSRHPHKCNGFLGIMKEDMSHDKTNLISARGILRVFKENCFKCEIESLEITCIGC